MNTRFEKSVLCCCVLLWTVAPALGQVDFQIGIVGVLNSDGSGTPASAGDGDSGDPMDPLRILVADRQIAVEAFVTTSVEYQVSGHAMTWRCELVSDLAGRPPITYTAGSSAMVLGRPDSLLTLASTTAVTTPGQCPNIIPCPNGNTDCPAAGLCLATGFCSDAPILTSSFIFAIPPSPSFETVPAGTYYVGEVMYDIPVGAAGDYIARPVCTAADVGSGPCFEINTELVTTDFPNIVSTATNLVIRIPVGSCCDMTGCTPDVTEDECPPPMLWIPGAFCDGNSEDCNGNGIDDECEAGLGISPDCNQNLVPDSCDIAAGNLLDLNLNGIPDICERCMTDADCIIRANGTPLPGIDPCAYRYCSNEVCFSCPREYAQNCPRFDSNVRIPDILCAVSGFVDYASCPNADIIMAGDLPGASGVPIGIADILAVVAGASAQPLFICPETSGNPLGCDNVVGFVPASACGVSLTSGIGGSQTPSSLSFDSMRSAPLVGDEVVDARFALVPRQRTARAGGLVDVDVFVSGVEGLVGFEMGVYASGGRRGGMILDSVTVDTQRTDYVFGDLHSFPVTDNKLGRLGGALMGTGVDVAADDRAYVGTFRFAVSPDAAGTFNVAASMEFAGLWTDGNHQIAVNPVDDAAILVSRSVGR